VTDAESTTARLGLPTTSRCMFQHKGEHVHKKMPRYACKVGVPGLGQQTRGGDVMRPRVAKRGLNGVDGVAGVSEGLHARARGQACGFEVILALAPPGRKRLISGDALASGGRSNDKRGGSGRLKARPWLNQKVWVCA
jgi:hypothetical protein